MVLLRPFLFIFVQRGSISNVFSYEARADTLTNLTQNTNHPGAGGEAPYDLNHKAHKEHKGKEKLFLVLFVCFVVPIQISQPVSILMFPGPLSLTQCHC